VPAAAAAREYQQQKLWPLHLLLLQPQLQLFPQQQSLLQLLLLQWQLLQ
jgi:protein-disulfide isomerase